MTRIDTVVHLRSAVLCVSVWLVVLVAGVQAETVILQNGNRMEGEVLKETEKHLVLDLGFRVLTIPSEEIQQIVSGDRDLNTGDQSVVHHDLWFERTDLKPKSVSQAAKQVEEAVVKVQTPIGMGSGFIIHKRGYVMTNNHVISGTRKISITVYRKQENSLVKDKYKKVRIIATAPGFDLALVKIEPTDEEEDDFSAVPLGNFRDLKKGETVFAVGSPMGLERTVTKGVVSLKNRTIREFPHIQTTAEINPGNSGGPLFNTRGEVVGVTNMKIRSILGAEGLGFAIPVNVVKWFLRTRNAFAFDTEHPNAGFRYYSPSRELDANRDTEDGSSSGD